MKWRPMGNPSSFQKSGIDMAGCPVALQIGVKGTNSADFLHAAMGSSGVDTKVPSGMGGDPRVGVRTTS